MRHMLGYVPQALLVTHELTVYENLMLAAQLRLPTSVSSEQRDETVRMTLHMLGLQECSHFLCIHTYIHTCIHTYIHAYGLQECSHFLCSAAYIYIHAYMHTYMLGLQECSHFLCSAAYIHTCMHAYIHARAAGVLPLPLQHAYIHTYIHAYMHTYMHTCSGCRSAPTSSAALTGLHASASRVGR